MGTAALISVPDTGRPDQAARGLEEKKNGTSAIHLALLGETPGNNFRGEKVPV